MRDLSALQGHAKPIEGAAWVVLVQPRLELRRLAERDHLAFVGGGLARHASLTSHVGQLRPPALQLPARIASIE